MDWNDIMKNYFVELMGVVKGVGSFASEQVPLYIKELLVYEFWHHAVAAFVAFMVTLLACKYFVHFRKEYVAEEAAANKESRYTFQDGNIFGIVITCIVMCVMTAITLCNFNTALKIKVAPRVVIVEKIQKLIKGSSSSCDK